jgi:uncharacterized membrane protein
MDIKETYEEIKSNPIKYLKTFAMDIVVVIVSIAYILYQMVKLEQTNLNPLVLLAQAIVGIICGVTIKQALGENGFSKGYNSDTWKNEEDKYNEACNSAIPYMERADNFYLYQEIEKKRNYRIQKLQSVRLKYDQWFDYDGNYIGTKEMFSKLKLTQKFAVKKCVKIKIYVLNLFSQYATLSDQDTHREITDKIQRGKNVTKNTIWATIIAVIGVYFVPVLNAWSWASFIGSTLQVALWVLFGVLQLYTNYNFVVQDKVALLRKKKEEIKKFITGCEKDLYIHSPYDSVVDIEKELNKRQILPLESVENNAQ